MSYVELYNERLTDLLEEQGRNGWGTSGSGGLNLKLNEDGAYSIVGLKKVVISDINQALLLLREGLERRKVGETEMNQSSSRSFADVILHVEIMDRSLGVERVFKSKLHLVDMAGSERADETKAAGERLKEVKLFS
jgi:hypothetical protein